MVVRAFRLAVLRPAHCAVVRASSWAEPRAARAAAETHHADVYQKPFYQRFRDLVSWCVDHRIKVILITLVVFAFNVLGDALRDVLDPRLRGSR